MNDQEQSSGDDCINVQAKSITINHSGMSYLEVRQVALDVFKANFMELSSKAAEIARKRAEEITEEFFRKIEIENPKCIDKAEDPDFQNALFSMQREYAKSGDKDLGSLLVDLLVDRSKQANRDIMQIVLNESLITAPKLTNDQISALSLIFIFKYTQNKGLGTHNLLGEYFDKHLTPILNNICKSQASFQHMEFSGCGSIGMGEISLEEILLRTYKGLFSKGFEVKKVDELSLNMFVGQQIFCRCQNNSDNLQIRALNDESLENMLKGIPENICSVESKQKIKSLFNENLMNANEVRNKCIEIRPYMKEIFDIWSSSSMKNFTLTSVGISIGHANVKRHIGEFANLSIWIN